MVLPYWLGEIESRHGISCALLVLFAGVCNQYKRATSTAWDFRLLGGVIGASLCNALAGREGVLRSCQAMRGESLRQRGRELIATRNETFLCEIMIIFQRLLHKKQQSKKNKEKVHFLPSNF
jgi:hypothetical protein